MAASKHVFKAESAKWIGGTSKVIDSGVHGGSLIGLSRPGPAAKFTRLPADIKLANHYTTPRVGTISVTISDQPPRKSNVRFSGALTRSFLHAIIELAIPAKATLAISLAI